jgi:hypothetical protein
MREPDRRPPNRHAFIPKSGSTGRWPINRPSITTRDDHRHRDRDTDAASTSTPLISAWRQCGRTMSAAAHGSRPLNDFTGEFSVEDRVVAMFVRCHHPCACSCWLVSPSAAGAAASWSCPVPAIIRKEFVMGCRSQRPSASTDDAIGACRESRCDTRIVVKPPHRAGGAECGLRLRCRRWKTVVEDQAGGV